jgi:16S rRNA (cytosine1402-N4)-methyltransferase
MRHVPVLLNEVIDSLQLKSGFKVIDCTLGDGGHSESMLEKIGNKGKLLGIDTDAESLFRAKNNLYRFADQIIFARSNFADLKNTAEKNGFVPADAILMDLGWSTPQFKERGRGFTFAADEPLDMRFDANAETPTAAEILNQSSAEDLYKIFHNFGEEKLSLEIAQAIVNSRKDAEIKTTGQLVEIVLQVYRKKLHTDKEIPWVGGTHPATQVFQALRVAVNKELEVIKQALPQALEILAKEGRLAVITFHSLEDRIVKQFFQKNSRLVRLVNRKPIIAGEKELLENPSARSAKLRVVEKI